MSIPERLSLVLATAEDRCGPSVADVEFLCLVHTDILQDSEVHLRDSECGKVQA